MKNIILTILALVVLAGVWLYLRKPEDVQVSNNTNPVVTNTNNNAGTVTNPNPDDTKLTDGSIVVELPKANSTTTSPLTLTGRARGNWFFEATAPVRVIDANGKTLGQSTIRAIGDWQTTNYVPFTGTVSYTLPSGTSTEGYVLFMNDNPSGDPSRGVSYKVPVHFKR